MKPRSWFESWLLVAALGGIAFGLGWKLLTDDPAADSTVIGLVFGAIAGAFAAPRMVETKVTREFGDRGAFVDRLDTQLAEMDIFPVTELDDFRVYKSEAAGSFSLGPVGVPGIVKRVRVRLQDRSAILVGPRAVLDQLQF